MNASGAKDANELFEIAIANNSQTKQNILRELKECIKSNVEKGLFCFDYEHTYSDIHYDYWLMFKRYVERIGLTVELVVSPPTVSKDLIVFKMSL